MSDVYSDFDNLLDKVVSYTLKPSYETPTLNGKTQEVINVDCRRGLATLPDASVDMVLTDPPYFIDGMGDDWNRDKLNTRISKGDVVRGLPVGMKFSKTQSQDLYNFMRPIADQWMRVVKPGGFVLCFMQPRLAHAVASAMDDAGMEIRDTITWIRQGQAKAFTQNHFIKKMDISEKDKAAMISKLGNRKTPQLRPMSETIILGQAPKDGTFVGNFLAHGVGLINTDCPVLEPDKFPSTVMYADKPSKDERYGHITPKPVDLLRHLIRIFGGDNPTVLDPFAGCGSCGEASVREGANFLGFEIDRHYAKISNNRIAEALDDANKERDQDSL